jgi:hypothetical protein
MSPPLNISKAPAKKQYVIFRQLLKVLKKIGKQERLSLAD